MAKIKVQDTEVTVITYNDKDYISLTDMVRNMENGPALIEKWLRNKNTVEFLGIWEEMYNPDFNSPEFEGIKNEAGLNRFILSVKQWVEKTNSKGIIAKAGRYGGTYAHKDIAFEFATWVSPQFKLYLLKEFQRLKEEEQAQFGWSAKRELSKADVKCSTKDTYEYYLKSLKSSLRYKRKGKKTGFIDSILIEHDDRIKTSHKFFLCQNIERDNRFAYQGRASIFIDGYSIIFPLYEIKLFNTLEVHHKRYPRSKNPWDVDDADLITLCSKCHKLEHQKFK